MAKFIAIRDSFGYGGTYWKEGETVEAAEFPNEHFALLSGSVDSPETDPAAAAADGEHETDPAAVTEKKTASRSKKSS
ncbi:hypothetical protein TAMA11512_21390 [Selenomonas sp. TAMA-11512]|uniref:hypothetical protein n=1 Tax=Selenomonas sp. TAMA-11512 TaxID=3095337 RepID=UPI00308B657C|nr:hypothetical protein TAMA11512_21390 [Selenomonas sp. TAMA-11512]